MDEGCSAWTQNCPEGFKCTLKADVSDTQCVIDEENSKMPGDVCVVNGFGFDNCEKGAFCSDVDAETLEGRCMPLCVEGDSPCPPDYYCYSLSRGGLDAGICIARCDVLEQDCLYGEVCFPNSQIGSICEPGSGEGSYGDPCEFVNACEPGLACLFQEAAPDCKGSGCCSPFCDTSAPNTCPGAGEVCTSWYGEGNAPAGEENLGICALP